MKRLMFCFLMLVFAVIQAHADGMINYCFEGKMGDRVSVVLAFQVPEDDDEMPVAGYIYYPKAKTPAPILLVGYVVEEGRYHLNEYQPDGTITGYINLTVKGEDYADGPIISSGEWTNPKTGATFELNMLKSPNDHVRTQMYMPDWYESPFHLADPAHIGKRYSYKRWHIGAEDWMGGQVAFRAAGKNKVHFDICNNPSNIAEGQSEAGRPAMLKGSEFTYERVNECGYGFRCLIFEKFLVIKTTTGPESLECFGAHTSFEGVYIKVED